jgi:hypothetical protein
VDAEYWREYRRKNKERLREYNRERRKQPKVKAQRVQQEIRRRARRRGELDTSPLPSLHPHLKPPSPGKEYIFWSEDLMHDLEQERELARLEGRDPDEAARRYRNRELLYHRETTRLFEESA